MPELPYLDERGDLHVTAAMANELRLAAGETGSTAQVEKVLGAGFYRDEVEPRLRARAIPRDPLDRLLDPTGSRWLGVIGMRIYIEPDPASPAQAS